MLSLAVKSLWARKRRAFTTTLAVMIGVSLVSGTYVLTDTINKAFDEIFTESLKGTSVVITAQQPVRQESGEVNNFSDEVLKKVREVDGVKLAAGAIFTPGGLFEQNGDTIGAQFSPKFISSKLPGPLEASKYVEGHPARSARQVTLDKQAASDAGLNVGDEIKVAGQRRAKLYKLVGLTELGGGISFGGASVAQLTLPESQKITDQAGKFDQIQVSAEDGVTPTELRKRIAQVTPSNLRIETAAQNASRQSSEIRDDLGFLTTALFVFATVALIVGAFVIFNTFSITVAQRVREFGLLRTLGASRRQILTSVTVESLLIGVIGAVAGLFAGLLIAEGIHGLFQAIGADIPTTALFLETRTVIVSLIVGISVTMLSSLSPALRSTRVPPMAALADIQQPPSRRRAVVYTVVASVLIAGGMALVLVGLFGNQGSGDAARSLGLGAAAVLFGVSLWSSRLVRPLAAVTGWPLQKLRGLVGRLARENSERNPGRTAATAAALMIGLAAGQLRDDLRRRDQELDRLGDRPQLPG